MSRIVELPLWVVVIALILAALGALDRVLAPSLRWVLRRRMERAVARLNARLQRPIQPFKLMARQDMIVRLVHDPKVSEAIAERAAEARIPETVAFEEARDYAREIVPGFSTLVYFGIATRLARVISRALFRVRVGQLDAAALTGIDPKATAIFVMNHRSNMDYVLVTWLVADRSALAYPVGEWARVWPLSRMFRAMGAYFIRRNSRNPLYRRVLARYVQMATAEGVTQAIFPEGGLSLDGKVGPPRIGLLHYILSGFHPGKQHDVVLIPVAISYDQVLEDRVLVEAAAAGERRFRAPFGSILRFAIRFLWRRLLGRERRFGYAAVSFGKPVSLARYVSEAPDASVEGLAEQLMSEVVRVMTVLPVPLACAALKGAPATVEGVVCRAQALAERLHAAGATVKMPQNDVAAGIVMALEALKARRLVEFGPDRLCAAPDAAPVLDFYAAGVTQILDAAAARNAGKQGISPPRAT